MVAADDKRFDVRFWGVRGTVPVPGPSTVRYGGNTACIEVTCGATKLIFDMGTGLRALGSHLVAQGTCQAHILLTHTHLDHIAGFPFFKPAYTPHNRFDLWSGHLRAQGLDLQSTLAGLMRQPLFPVPIGLMHAAATFHDMHAGDVLSLGPGVTVCTAPLNHPGGATGYRVEYAGKVFALITDTEHETGKSDRNVLRLIEAADLVVYDATYTDEEFKGFIGWGHSTWQEGVRLCRAAGARQLVLFHHEPERSDDALDAIARRLHAELPSGLVGAEGLVLHL
ncbi:MAG: MBL fold metallo-hydrolase [Geminicoccaceae bacterium]|nr:MAG: MBL fold metallo-hydrolase [Geminicoccaceae bacterium]